MSYQPFQLKTATEERIVEAAVQLFSRRGFRGSSTRAIAGLAGVHEVTLFRHFPRKRDLFWAATVSRLSRLRINSELAARMEANADPSVILPSLVEFLAEKLCYQSELTRLLYLGLFELDSGDQQVFGEHLGPLLQPIHEYLARCVSARRLRCSDPGAATLGLIASVLIHHAAPDLLSPAEATRSDPTSPAHSCSTFWVEVLLAR